MQRYRAACGILAGVDAILDRNLPSVQIIDALNLHGGRHYRVDNFASAIFSQH